MQSIKYLLEYLFTDINSSRYNQWILLDLNRLMSNNISSSFLDFFHESSEERHNLNRNKFCNIEQPFFDQDVE